MFKALHLVLVSVFLLSGCQAMQTIDPYSGATQTSKTAKYGGLGALSGAVIGGIANGADGALIGAVVGGTSGLAFGSYTDQKEAMLRQELQGTGVQIARYGDDLKLIMPGAITFNSSQAAIKSSFYPVLNSVAKVTNKFDKTWVDVRGYTDSSGGFEINFPLSQNRANAVGHYLVSQGVAANRLSIFAMASANPIADNGTPEGRAMNRRVEISLRPRS